MTKAWAAAVGAVVVVVLGACGGNDDPPAPSSTPSTAVTTTTPSLPPTSASAPCRADVLLVPVQAALNQPDDPSQGLSAVQIVRVEVLECRNGYARVAAFAAGDQAAGDQEAEQVFLRDVGGRWEFIESGTGIDCQNLAGLTAAIQEACAALAQNG
jgi:hypothetical protein